MENPTQSFISYQNQNQADLADSSSSGLPVWSGFVFLLGSSFFWGSMFIPTKHFEIGDAFFFQLVLVKGLWLVGFIINAMRGFPEFHSLPIVGGLLMSMANISSIYSIRYIGIGMSFIFWNATGIHESQNIKFKNFFCKLLFLSVGLWLGYF